MMPLSFYLSQWSRLPPAPRGPLLEGKTVVVTGSNVGLGFEAALQFAACSPAHLILAVRNLKAGAEALEKLLKKHPKVRAEVWELDLSKYASVKAFAQRAEKELAKVDVLVNNGAVNPGVQPKPIQKTGDGHEHTIQVNVLSTFLLTLLMQPVLARSSEPKVVFTSSEVHSWADPSLITQTVGKNEAILSAFDNGDLYNNPGRYFISKLLLQMLVRKLIPALPNVTIVAVNPGLCRTTLLREFPPFGLGLISIMLWFMTNARSAEAGARNITLAALAKDSVEYWSDCGPAASESKFLGTGIGFESTERLWAETLKEMEAVSPGSTKVLEL